MRLEPETWPHAAVTSVTSCPWAVALRRQFAHGEVIVRQGETPQGLFVVFDGRCTVTRELAIHEGGRTRMRQMHLETLMPRDTCATRAPANGNQR